MSAFLNVAAIGLKLANTMPLWPNTTHASKQKTKPVAGLAVVDAALANYFRPGNLGALRELAL